MSPFAPPSLRSCEHTVVENLSSFYLPLENSQVFQGMLIAIPPAVREIIRNLTTAQLASLLKQLAVRVLLKTLQEQTRGPERPQPKQKYSGNGQHVATAKRLARRIHEIAAFTGLPVKG